MISEIIEHSDLRLTAGIAYARYDAMFRNKHQVYLSALKQLGFGQRCMETRINVEVDELVKQFRLTNGQPFDPKAMLLMCVSNVIVSVVLGRRLPFGDQKLVDIVNRIDEWFKGVISVVDFFPILRFLPPIRRSMQWLIESHRMMLDIIEQEVSVHFHFFSGN
jgi:hypothetical protein